jgi:hypothetical protein
MDLQHIARFRPPRQTMSLSTEPVPFVEKRVTDVFGARYVGSMAERKARILLIDEDPIRLSSAATLLILSGYSVLALNCQELSVALNRDRYDWRVDLVLIRAVLDAATEKLFENHLRFTPIRKLSRVATPDSDLLKVVNELIAETRLASNHK